MVLFLFLTQIKVFFFDFSVKMFLVLKISKIQHKIRKKTGKELLSTSLLDFNSSFSMKEASAGGLIKLLIKHLITQQIYLINLI